MYEFKSPYNGIYDRRVFETQPDQLFNNELSELLKPHGSSLVKLIVMRITLICCFVTFALLNVSASVLHAQNISIKKVNAPLYEVFNEIRNQTGYDFFINNELLKGTRPVTVNMKNATIEEVLQQCFKDQPVTYEIKENKTVIVKRVEKNILDQLSALFETPKSVVPRQDLMARGIVRDSIGRPLSGVHVAIRGKKTVVYTKADGTFEIPIPVVGTVLTFSYMGMEPQDYKVEVPSITARITMKVESRKLDDVVITGYNNIKKESFTGNSIKVTKEQLLKVGNRNVIDILQVFDPSFRLEVNNLRGSDPNTLPQFYIRGRSGIGNKELDPKSQDISQAALTNNPNLPIFIMDGYEVTVQKVYDYDINLIKSVTILKDAAATAVYGSRAANGVIVIETIPPVAGKFRVNYTATATLTAPDLSDYNLMDSKSKLEAERLAGIYDIKGRNTIDAAFLTNELIRKTAQVTRGVNTDWSSQALTNEINQKHSLYVDGGSEQIRIGVSLRHDNQNGVMKASRRNRNGAGLTLDYRLNKFQIRNDINYDMVSSIVSPYGSFADYTWKAPYDEIYDTDGNVLKNTNNWHSGATPEALNLINPLYEALKTQNYNKSENQTLSNNLSLNWTLVPNLQLRGQFSLTKTESKIENFIDPASGRYALRSETDLTTVGQLSMSGTSSLSLNSSLFANYLKTIGNHSINVSMGLNGTESTGNSNSVIYTGFSSGSQHYPNMASKILGKPAHFGDKSRLIGAFSNLNYSFRDIYLLDLSARIDGSSAFGSERKYAPFWSVGTGINIHKYQFLADNPVISRARITANMGQLGKTSFAPFAAKDSYANTSNWYSTGSGLSLFYMGNPALTWEKTNTYDLIMDFGFLRDRITVNFNGYRKITRDLVNDINLPLSSGFEQYTGNIGKVENKGYELQLRGDLIKRKDFYLALYANYNVNTNKLIEIENTLKKYNDLVDQQYADYGPNLGTTPVSTTRRFSTPHVKYVEGGSLTSVFGMRSLGINPMNGKEVFLRKDGTITYDWSASDQVIIGDGTPKGQGAFGINASYKGITLFASFLYEYGRDEYNYTLLNKVENVDIYNRNADMRFLTDRWKQPGDIAKYKNIADASFTTRPTSRFMQRNNLISFNSLSIGYSLNPRMLRSLGNLNSLRIQLNTNNLARISTVKQERGLEYPYARTFDMSLNLGF